MNKPIDEGYYAEYERIRQVKCYASTEELVFVEGEPLRSVLVAHHYQCTLGEFFDCWFKRGHSHPKLTAKQQGYILSSPPYLRLVHLHAILA